MKKQLERIDYTASIILQSNAKIVGRSHFWKKTPEQLG
jgi:hypothetical protein